MANKATIACEIEPPSLDDLGVERWEGENGVPCQGICISHRTASFFTELARHGPETGATVYKAMKTIHCACFMHAQGIVFIAFHTMHA